VVRTAQATDVNAKERVAKTACLAGDFAKGVAILSELYVTTNDEAFIYNQGRCFEQNHRYEDAISRFQEYLRIATRISKAGKADAQKHISDCQSLLAKQGTATSAGEPMASKEAKERAARKACLTGDPTSGVGILADLFIDTHNTTYLFNQGRCLEQNRRYEDAISRFREYLMKAKDLDAEEKADTQKHIAACESYLRDKPSDEKRPEAPKKTIDDVQPPRPEPTAPEVIVAEAKPSGGRAGSGLRAAGIAVAVLGGVGLGAGVVLNLKVNGMATDLENGYDPSVASSRKNYKNAMWMGYGAGAACLVSGTILYYLGWRHGQDATPLALVPTVGPDMAGTAIWGSF
jgi:Flp pilus assembly protein TadD